MDIPVTEPTDPTDETTTVTDDTDQVGSDDSTAPVVPEPSSLLMLAVGSVFGGAIYKRRQKKLKNQTATDNDSAS